MDHYIEILLRPDPEFPPDVLMDALYAKLHRALVRHAGNDIGISFPNANNEAKRLGTRLRLHGLMATLGSFLGHEWLTGMRDHVDVTEVLQVPVTAKHRVVRRVQAKSNVERLRRRQMRRHGLSEEEARVKLPEHLGERLKLPYVQVKSASSNQRFLVFIEHCPVIDRAQPGEFGSYGLSSVATIPWF